MLTYFNKYFVKLVTENNVDTSLDLLIIFSDAILVACNFHNHHT